jgi:hypothetical protein
LTVNGLLLDPDSDSIGYQPPVITNASLVAQSYAVALTANTPATIQLPTNTVFFGIRMPANNNVLVTLKSVSGDTGFALHKTFGLPVIAIDPSQTSFVLLAATNVTVQLTTG